MKSIYRLIFIIAFSMIANAQVTTPSMQQSSFNVGISYSPPYIYPGSVVQLYITVISMQTISKHIHRYKFSV